MSIDALFTDPTGLPRTVRGGMPYWVGALTPRETWGHGHASTTVDCGQTWSNAATWLRYMLGEWEVRAVTQAGGTRRPDFVRYIPEPLRYPEVGDGSDTRVQWCTGLTQTDQGGNPVKGVAAVLGIPPWESEETFSQQGTGWPQAGWCKYQGVWETTAYVIRNNDQIIDLQSVYTEPEDREFLRYVVRQKRTYSKEQPIPSASTAGGFKTIPEAKAIGQVGFRVVNMADVTYKWCMIPLGWPPYPGWTIGPGSPWPAENNINKPRLRDLYIGSVNSDNFDYTDPEGYNWEVESLLYTGYEEEVFYNAAGQRTANVTYKFKYKEGGWNRFLDATGRWRAVSLDGTSAETTTVGGVVVNNKPYAKNDFRDLFRYVSGT